MTRLNNIGGRLRFRRPFLDSCSLWRLKRHPSPPKECWWTAWVTYPSMHLAYQPAAVKEVTSQTHTGRLSFLTATVVTGFSSGGLDSGRKWTKMIYLSQETLLEGCWRFSFCPPARRDVSQQTLWCFALWPWGLGAASNSSGTFCHKTNSCFRLGTFDVFIGQFATALPLCTFNWNMCLLS